MDLTVSAKMTVQKFYDRFSIKLDDHTDWTLEELMQSLADHPLEKDDVVVIEPYYLTVKEAKLSEVISVTISTHLE